MKSDADEIADIKRRMESGERTTPVDPAKGLAITVLERRVAELEAKMRIMQRLAKL
jgi:hypothetical protein